MNKTPTPSIPKLDDELSDFYASLRLLSGEVSLRLLFRRIMLRAKHEKGITANEINLHTKVSKNSISGFKNGHCGLTVESFEKVINYILSK